MSNTKDCFHCENFILKLMLNGYDGVCEKHGCFTNFGYICDDFKRGKNRIYKKGENDDEG